jgi:hypothetical protein
MKPDGMRRPVSDGMLYAPRFIDVLEAREIKDCSAKSADGRVAAAATWKRTQRDELTPTKNLLDSDPPSHGRR